MPKRTFKTLSYRFAHWVDKPDEAIIAELNDITCLQLTVDLESPEQVKHCSRVLTLIREMKIKKLDFSGSYFNGGDEQKEQLQEWLMALPLSVDELWMNDVHLVSGVNNIGNRPPSEVIEIFQAIPAHITRLSVARNSLGDLKENLIECMRPLSSKLTMLDLSSNFLNRLNDDAVRQEGFSSRFVELIQVISEKCAELRTLNLSNCGLQAIPVSDWKDAFLALPPTINRMRFRRNYLDTMSELTEREAVTLAALFSAKDMRHVDLDGNGLHENVLGKFSMFQKPSDAGVAASASASATEAPAHDVP